MDLVLVRWLCSQFQVQLGLTRLALLPEYLSWGPAKGEALPRVLLSWHTAQVQEKVETHDTLPPLLMLLAKGGCRAKANVKDQASALFF